MMMVCRQLVPVLVSFLLLLSTSLAFPIRFTRMPRQSSLYLGVSDFTDLTSSFMTAVDNKPDDYVYGAVAAPDWVLPLGAFLVILTAAIPVLLKPGEEALDQQRENEKITNNKFNKRQNKDL